MGGSFTHDGIVGATVGVPGCGIGSGSILNGAVARPEPACDIWPSDYQNAFESFKPAVSVLMVGTTEIRDRVVDGRTLPRRDAGVRGLLPRAAGPGHEDPHRERHAAAVADRALFVRAERRRAGRGARPASARGGELRSSASSPRSTAARCRSATTRATCARTAFPASASTAGPLATRSAGCSRRRARSRLGNGSRVRPWSNER